MPACIQPKQGYAVRKRLLGKPPAYNIKQPEIYKKASAPTTYVYGQLVR